MGIFIGLQLYTLRDDMKKDFSGTIRKVSEMGYQGVEFFDYGGYAAKELKTILEGLNLKAVNTHISIERMEEDADLEVRYALELGVKDITIPFLPAERRKDGEDYRKIARTLQKLGIQCKKSGLQLDYHNHYFEFDKQGNTCGMDIILSNTDPENLMIELDTFWVQDMGMNPIAYIESHSKRIRMIHLKDRYKDADRKSEISPFAEIGNGIMDIQGIINISREMGIEWLIVEQDRCRRPAIESVKISADYLKKSGII